MKFYIIGCGLLLVVMLVAFVATHRPENTGEQDSTDSTQTQNQ